MLPELMFTTISPGLSNKKSPKFLQKQIIDHIINYFHIWTFLLNTVPLTWVLLFALKNARIYLATRIITVKWVFFLNSEGKCIHLHTCAQLHQSGHPCDALKKTRIMGINRSMNQTYKHIKGHDGKSTVSSSWISSRVNWLAQKQMN